MFRLYSLLLATLFTGSLHAQSWDLLTPVNSGGIVRSCSFIDEMNGYIVVQVSGEVYGTHDGGATWFRPWTPGISTNLYDVEMASEDVIFTCGTSGEIFRSVDAGTSWVEMDTPTNEYLYSLEFVTESLGFCSGFNGVLMRTTDGGTNWELLETGTTDRLWDVEFVDDQNGYACGWNGTIIRTNDGGDTWDALDTGYDGALFNCSFPSDQVGYAVGWSQTILKTEDGGDTWTLQFTNGNNALNYVEFRDENNGWAAGNWGGYYSTSNGGTTWSPSTFLGGVEVWGGQYLNENCALMTAVGNVYKSTDNGATWEVLKNAVPNAKYNGVYFLDDLHGYACGSVGVTGEGSNQAGIVYTENGGQTWDIQAQGWSSGWWDIHFLNENEGSVIGAGNYMNTSNGGENWSGGSFPELLTGVGIHRLSSTEILAGGDGLFNNICKSSDSGFNWECGENLSAKDFFFLNDQEGWAISEGGTSNIFHTTDAGETWEYVDTGFGAGKASMYWLDNQTGWIGTTTGAVLRTTDGGATWETSSLNYDIVGIRFYDTLLGFAGDNQGNIWRSEDGGANWDVILFANDLVMPVVQEVHFTDNYAYAGCWSGEIYRATLGCGTIDPPIITTQTEWCEGESNFVGFESTAVTQAWDWTVPDGWDFTGDFGVIDVTAGSTSGEIGLTITNACGLTSSAVYAVEVLPAPSPIESLNAPLMACEGETFTVEVPTAQDGVDYTWTPPAGWTYFDLGGSIEVTPNETSGAISVYGENQCGITEPFAAEIAVNLTPEVSLDLGATELCQGSSADAVGLPLGGTLEGEGVMGLTIQSGSLEADVPYEYSYTYVDDNGCTASATATLMFLALPDVSIAFDALGNCIGSTLSPTLSPAGGTLTGEGVDGTTIQTAELLSDSPYTYSYNYTAENGCSAFSTTEVTFYDAPEVSFTFPETGLCVESVIEPELIPAGGELSGEGVNGTTIETTGLTAGEAYAYAYTYTDENGCTASTPGILILNDLPEVSLSFEEDVFCTESTYEAQVSPEGGVFEGPGVGGLLVQSFFLNPGEPYTFTYTYEDENGCVASASQTLEFGILPNVSLDFPYEEFCLEDTYNATVLPDGGTLEGPGVTNLFIDPSELEAETPYTYTYTYEAENGCINTDEVVLTFSICIGVDEFGNVLFNIYPNPAQDLVTLQTEALIGQTVQLLDAAGKVVMQQRISNTTTQLDLSGLSAGMYVVRVGDVSGVLVVE